MVNKGMRIYLLSFALMTALGCSTMPMGSFSVLSTKNVNINDQKFELVRRRVKGISKRPIIIIIPMGSPIISEAVDNALNNGQGDILTNVTLTVNSFYIPYIYGESSYEIVGDVLKARRKEENLSSTDELIPDIK